MVPVSRAPSQYVPILECDSTVTGGTSQCLSSGECFHGVNKRSLRHYVGRILLTTLLSGRFTLRLASWRKYLTDWPLRSISQFGGAQRNPNMISHVRIKSQTAVVDNLRARSVPSRDEFRGHEVLLKHEFAVVGGGTWGRF